MISWFLNLILNRGCIICSIYTISLYITHFGSDIDLSYLFKFGVVAYLKLYEWVEILILEIMSGCALFAKQYFREDYYLRIIFQF